MDFTEGKVSGDSEIDHVTMVDSQSETWHSAGAHSRVLSVSIDIALRCSAGSRGQIDKLNGILSSKITWESTD